MQLKLILITIMSFIFLLATQHIFISSEMKNAFNQVEQRQAEEAYQRLTSALQAKKKYIEFKLYDWAVWDETYDYLMGKNQDYLKRNISDPQVFFKALQIDFSVIYDLKGVVKFVASNDTNELGQNFSIPQEITNEIWKRISVQKDSTLSGFMNINGKPILFSSIKVSKSDRSGIPVGFFFAAEQINDSFASKISESISKKTYIQNLDLHRPESPRIQMKKDDLMSVTATIVDIDKKPIAEISILDQRDVHITFNKSTNRMNIFLLVVLTLMFALVSFTLHRTVIKPLQNFMNWQRSLIKSGSWTTNRYEVANRKWPTFSKLKNDEIFDLATTTNALLDKIEDSSQVIQKQTLVLINAEKIRGLGELSAGMAHEINNPLAIVFSHLTLMRRIADSPEIDKEKLNASITKLESMAQRIKKIVSGLITFARDGNNDPFIKGLLSTPISETIELIQERIRSNNIKLTYHLDESIEVNFRPGQISQIVLNLIGNSVDAIAHLENKWIKIETYKDFESAFIKITDSGNGIPVEIRNKILQPFFTTKEVGKGTGLGLSISLGLIQDHKGTLKIDHDNPNTCFVIQFPLAEKNQLQSLQLIHSNSSNSKRSS